MRMNGKLNAILLLPLLVVSSAVFAQTSSATVRGMLEDNTAKNPQPVSGVLVTLEGRNYTSPAVHSGKDGLYYISNVAPGAYTLKVWSDPKNPLSFPIKVSGPLTDIPPVIVAPTNAAGSKAHSVKSVPAAKSKTGSGNR